MNTKYFRSFSRKSGAGFTLIELLTVIAIIGILAAILVPTTTMVRRKAKKTQTKVLFQNWVAGMETFKQEYGYFPEVDKPTPTGTRVGLLNTTAFAAAMTGRKPDGTTLTSTEMDNGEHFGNTKTKTFVAFVPSDFDSAGASLVDSFGNVEIGVIVDRNGDGFIKKNDDYGAGKLSALKGVRAGNPVAGATYTPSDTLATDDIPPKGLRANVIFYSAGLGTAQEDVIFSWK